MQVIEVLFNETNAIEQSKIFLMTSLRTYSSSILSYLDYKRKEENIEKNIITVKYVKAKTYKFNPALNWTRKCRKIGKYYIPTREHEKYSTEANLILKTNLNIAEFRNFIYVIHVLKLVIFRFVSFDEYY